MSTPLLSNEELKDKMSKVERPLLFLAAVSVLIYLGWLKGMWEGYSRPYFIISGITIFSGDFLQLGPIPGLTRLDHPPLPDRSQGPPLGLRVPGHLYAFQSACWREAGLETYTLTTVHRQRDRSMIDALNRMFGKPDAEK